MDFSGVTIDTAEGVGAAVDYILDLNISPSDKKARIAKVMEAIGNDFHNQLYTAASEVFDSTAISTVGYDNADAQVQRLADKVVRNYALSREVKPLIQEYYDSLLGKAQSEAFQNALSMQKHPTLERIVIGETCEWCESKAGTHINPSGEDFSRHKRCDCLFKVSGFNSRNGLLTNYVKKA